MRNSRILANLAHRLVAVHLRHHDVHQHDAQVRRALDELDRLPAVGRAQHLHVLVLEHASSARRCCARRRRRPAPCGRAGPRSSRAAARACCRLASGRSATTRCRNSAVSSNSRSGDCTSLSTTLLATVLQPRLLLGVSSLPGEDDDRHVAQRRLRLHPSRAARSRSCRAAADRRRSSRTARSRSTLERFGAGADRRDLDVVVHQQLDDALRARCRCPRRPAAASCAARRKS